MMIDFLFVSGDSGIDFERWTFYERFMNVMNVLWTFYERFRERLASICKEKDAW